MNVLLQAMHLKLYDSDDDHSIDKTLEETTTGVIDEPCVEDSNSPEILFSNSTGNGESIAPPTRQSHLDSGSKSINESDTKQSFKQAAKHKITDRKTALTMKRHLHEDTEPLKRRRKHSGQFDDADESDDVVPEASNRNWTRIRRT